MKTKNETLPEGTITNFGVIQKDGTTKPLNTPITEVMTEEEVTELKRRADAAKEVPVAVVKVEGIPTFDDDQVRLIKSTVGKDLTDGEFGLFMYLSKQYGLDPIRRQIWAIKYGNSPAQIFTGRDGFLAIAHRSGHFDGMESKIVEYDEKGVPVKATCEVWRTDMSHPFKSEVLFKEYTTGKNLWIQKPSVMLLKCVESTCLRKAFSVSGLYDPAEVGV